MPPVILGDGSGAAAFLSAKSLPPLILSLTGQGPLFQNSPKNIHKYVHILKGKTIVWELIAIREGWEGNVH